MFSSFIAVTLEKELDSSNSCKRRQSEPPISGNSSHLPRDESYVKALSKFNEWRQRQIFGGSTRLSRKQSRKLIKTKDQKENFFEKITTCDDREADSKSRTATDNSLYEEIEENQHESSTSPDRNILDIVPIRHSFPTAEAPHHRVRRNTSIRKPNDLQIYENAIVELVNQGDPSPDTINLNQHLLSPPVKFFKENSNPFENIRTPIRGQTSENHSSDWDYESPRDLGTLDALRAAFRPFEVDDSVRYSASNNGRSSRNPPYQTVINKHGDKVEYALPLNEKLDEDEDFIEEKDCGVVALNNTSSYQQFVEDNFQFLNSKERLAVSRMSISFSRNQYNRENVIVTDLDKTNGTKLTDEQNNSQERDIIRELESLEIWSRNLSKNIENNSIKKQMPSNMHFAEIIVCNNNEVTESAPRQVFQASNGTLHSGTFHCVPVTQFKPHRREQHYAESTLQLNYLVLRKIRHPDIALLMGVTVDNRCVLDSLILEPLNCSLNHLIHKEECCIPPSVCLLYALQINNAVTYLHKNGLVHSNISTHSIVMCPASERVKLTSFELTTTINGDLRDELLAISLNENQNINNVTQIPLKLRPYNVVYRKTFSQHNYQAPELLSNRFAFVYPKIQCDIYGICLALWEMLNCSIPFADFDYEEMMKLIYLQDVKLPTIIQSRQRPFDNILPLGLKMDLEKRFSDTIELNKALQAVLIDSDDKIDAPSEEEEKLALIKDASYEKPSIFNQKAFGSMIYDRTSTIKKRKNDYKENRLTAKQLFFYPQVKKTKETSDMIVPSHTSSPNSPRYGFEIGEVSIPETPIARSNKLRKTAWLSNQSISPIVHLEIKSKDDDTAINQIQVVENKVTNAPPSEDGSSSKLYNVNIRIRPNIKKQVKTPSRCEDDNSPGDLQKSSSQISEHIRFFNIVSKSTLQPEHLQVKTPSPMQNLVNYDKNNATKPSPVTEKVLNQYPKTPVSQKRINEFFSRTQPAPDFENSLWRREKQKCDQSVSSQRRISVKDTVTKFESFSKSMLGEPYSPVVKRPILSNTPNSDENTKESLNSEPPTNDVNLEKMLSTLSVKLKASNDDCPNELDEKSVLPQLSKVNSECFTQASDFKQSPILTMNFKRLDRRASDLGSYFVHQNTKAKTLTARHSIYGSEIFKRLRRVKASTENEREDVKESKAGKTTFNTNVFQDKKDFKIKVGQLTCLNCGHKLFVVDDVVSANSGEDNNEGYRDLLLTPLKRNLGPQQVNKSSEDFYIDDDFCEDFELCANMELGTRSQLSDLIDFDILSAEIFNPIEEKFTQIA